MSKLTDQQEAAMRKAFLDAIAGIKDQARLADLQSAIARNDFEAVITLLGLDRAAFAPVEGAVAESFAAGGAVTAAQIGRVPVPAIGAVVLRFDVRNPPAEKWLVDHSSRLITEIIGDQREVIRGVLTTGMELGSNPRTTAMDIVGRINPATGKRQGGVIGLTTQQAGWINSARKELETLDARYLDRALRDQRFDGAVKRAIALGEPLSKADIDKAITQMQNRALKYRADVIARTESIDALRAGQEAAIEQAVELGEVDRQDLTATWDSSGPDGRTRDQHLAMEGVKAGPDGVFTMPDGSRLRYPGDRSLGAPASQLISCRCRKKTTISFLGKQARIEGFG